MDVVIVVAEIFGIFAAIIAAGWVLGRTVLKSGFEQGKHTQDHEELRGDVDAAHEKLRYHDERISKVESSTSELSGKMDALLENQKIMLSHLVSKGQQ